MSADLINPERIARERKESGIFEHIATQARAHSMHEVILELDALAFVSRELAAQGIHRLVEKLRSGDGGK